MSKRLNPPRNYPISVHGIPKFTSVEEAFNDGPEVRLSPGARLLGTAVAREQAVKVDTVEFAPTINDNGLGEAFKGL